MAIETGTRLPEASFLRMGANGPEQIEIGPLVSNRKVVLCGLPGAFTGTCTAAHIPSFIRTIDAFRDKGVEDIIVVSVNDPHVMKAWGETTGGTAAGLTFLADPECKFTEAIGLRFDAPAAGLIARCQRFAAIVDDGVVEHIRMETQRGVCDLTSGETLLELV